MASDPRELQLRELKDMMQQLKKTVELQTQMITALKASLDAANQLAAQRQETIEYLKKQLYGASSEKRRKPETPQADGQLTLFDMYAQIFDEAEYHHDPKAAEQEQVVVVKEHVRKSRKTNAEKYKDLPTEVVEVPLPESEQSCPDCGTRLVRVGKEYVREELVYIPATLKLVKYYRTTYKCPSCTEGYNLDQNNYKFVKSVVPPALIPHGPASPSVVSWCIYQKYALSLPLYRQEKDWLQFGVELSRTTIANWIINCVDRYFIHLYGYFHRELLKREFLMADETRVQVLKEPERRAQSQSYMWLVRSGEDGLPPVITFGYTETRAGYNIENFLKGYRGGYLETDGYQGYNNLKNIKRCCCWSHVRRYFMDAIPKGKQDDFSDPAVQAVQYCDKLFMHERYCKEHGYSFEQRKEYRLKKSKPAIDSFFEWLEKQHPVVNSRLDKAVKYAQNRKQYLYTYLEDGRCSLSNNLSENSIRPFTVGRRNWLFCATPEGANASAVAYTMVEMAKAHDLNIFKYLTYILEHRPDKNMTDDQLALLAPWNQEVINTCKNKIK